MSKELNILKNAATAENSNSPEPVLPLTASLKASRFGAQVLWTLVVRILMTANSVIAGIIIARWLGAEGLGQLAVINVSVGTLVQLGSWGLPSANTYFIAKDRRHLGVASINSLVFVFVLGSLLAAGLILLATIRPNWFNFIPQRLIAIAAISLPFQVVTLVGLNIFLALGRIERFNLLDLAGQAFVLINALAAVLLLEGGLLSLVTLNTATSVLIALIIMLLISGYRTAAAKSEWRVDLSFMRSMLRYGLKFHIAILAGALIFRADLLVVNHFRGSAEAGVYSVASQVGLMIMMLPGVIATLLFPRVTAEQDLSANTTCLVSRHTAFILFFCCVLTIPFSYVLPILYGSAFADVPVQLLILLPGIFLVGIESVLVQHLNAIGLPRAVPLFWLVTLATNIALVFILVPRYGSRGAAVASTLSYVLIFALVTFYFFTRTSRKLSDAFILSRQEARDLLTFRNLKMS